MIYRRLVLSCSVVQNCQVDICQAVDKVAVRVFIDSLMCKHFCGKYGNMLCQLVIVGRTELILIQYQCRRQSSVKVLLVQHANCTVSDLVNSSPVYNDLSWSGIVL